MSTRSPRRIAAVLAALLLPLLAACGDDDDGSSPGPAGTTAARTTLDPAAAARVPEALRTKGTLVVGTDASYAPNEFFAADGKTIQGMDVDLGKAIGAKLGLTLTFRNSAFDAIIPGIQSRKFDLGMSSFTDNAEREKEVDMVTYFTAGTSLAARPGSGLDVANLCGRTIAVQKGTVQLDDLTARNKQCGAQQITIRVLQLQTDVTLAVASGRADGMLADSPVAAYAVRQSGGKLELVGESYDNAPYGIAVPKGSTLAEAIRLALESLEASGEYLRILQKWGVEDGAITEFRINAAAAGAEATASPAAS